MQEHVSCMPHADGPVNLVAYVSHTVWQLCSDLVCSMQLLQAQQERTGQVQLLSDTVKVSMVLRLMQTFVKSISNAGLCVVVRVAFVLVEIPLAHAKVA